VLIACVLSLVAKQLIPSPVARALLCSLPQQHPLQMAQAQETMPQQEEGSMMGSGPWLCALICLHRALSRCSTPRRPTCRTAALLVRVTTSPEWDARDIPPTGIETLQQDGISTSDIGKLKEVGSQRARLLALWFSRCSAQR